MTSDSTLSPDLYREHKTAINALSSALKGGFLTLFIGAGIGKSTKSGFPNWPSLVKNCCGKTGVVFDESRSDANDYLLKITESVQTKAEDNGMVFCDIVAECLHKDVEYNLQQMKKDLLVALGSLVMNSIRGGARSVFNYNFDDLLEWYLVHHGFCVDIISSYPKILSHSDIGIFHPHGFLPKIPKFAGSATQSIIFSKKDYELAMTSEVNPWNEIQRAELSSSLALFVGLSGDDPHISSLCTKVYTTIIKKQRILGFQILCKDEKNESIERDNLKNRGIVTVYIDDYDDLPDYLLSICRCSAGLE